MFQKEHCFYAKHLPQLYKQVTFLFLLYHSSGFSPAWLFAALIIFTLQLLIDCNLFHPPLSLSLASFFLASSTGHMLLHFYFLATPLEYILDALWSSCFLFAERWLSLQSLTTVRQILTGINLQNSTILPGIVLIYINREPGLKSKGASFVIPQKQRHYLLSSV